MITSNEKTLPEGIKILRENCDHTNKTNSCTKWENKDRYASYLFHLTKDYPFGASEVLNTWSKVLVHVTQNNYSKEDIEQFFKPMAEYFDE